MDALSAMKTIGLLGGMSWHSTLAYYRHINETTARRLGGLHSARLLLYSVDFADIERMQRSDDWDGAGRALAQAAQALERAGADLLLIGTNMMHRVADAVQRAVRIPLLHVADATAARIRQAGLTRVGLLGTRYTMEHDFLKSRLAAHGLQVMVPSEEDRKTVHRIIFEELCQGVFLDESRRRMMDVVERLAGQGAEGVIWGCTEIALLLRPKDSPLPVFDTTLIHAESAVAAALGEEVRI